MSAPTHDAVTDTHDPVTAAGAGAGSWDSLPAGPRIGTGPVATVGNGLRHTGRRVASTVRWVRETPGEVLDLVRGSSPADAVMWARDMTLPSAHGLADPPPGSGLRPVPGHAGEPVIGCIRGLTGDRVAWLMDSYEAHGPVFWAQLAGRRVVVVVGPDEAGQILVNADKDFSNDGWQELIGKFFDRGLMLLSFGEHLDHRRIMQSAFTPARLRGYLAGMDRRITADLDAAWPLEGQTTLYQRMKDLAMRVAADVFLGVELDKASRDHLLAGFHAQPRAATELVRVDLPWSLWGRGRNGYDDVTRWLRAQLPAKRAGEGEDLFSAMVHARDDDGSTFSDEEIVRHMNFMWFAAHDTTTLAMEMMAWGFAAHPEWQERAYEESAALGDGPLDPADLGKLQAIELVMNEVMRLWPPVPAMVRQAVRDCALGDHFIPEGTWIAVMNPGTHRLPEHWTDPDTFDPGRFEEGREEHKAHKHLYYPFGAGAHKCIGFAFAQLETKAMWHRLLLTRRFSVEPGYTPPMGWKALPEPLDDLPVTIQPH